MEPKPVVPELQHYYHALAIAAMKAKEDPDWTHTWLRLEELTSLVEDIVNASKTLGWKDYEKLVVAGYGLVEAVSIGSHELMRKIIEIEDSAKPLARRVLVARLYVVMLRQLAAISLLILGIMIIMYSTTMTTSILGILASGLGIAAWLLYKTPWSNTVLVGGLIFGIISSMLEPFPEPLLIVLVLTLILSLLSIPLSKTLHKIFNVAGRGA